MREFVKVEARAVQAPCHFVAAFRATSSTPRAVAFTSSPSVPELIGVTPGLVDT
jgi:hypothetical protein